MKKSIKVTIGENILELKDIEVYEKISDETTAFSADIYLNGKKIGDVRNNGQGEGNYPRVYGEDAKKLEALERKMSEHVFHYNNYQWPYNMDFLLGDMVEDCWYGHKNEYSFKTSL